MGMNSQLDSGVYSRFGNGGSLGDVFGTANNVIGFVSKARDMRRQKAADEKTLKDQEDEEYLNQTFGRHLQGWDGTDKAELARRSRVAADEVVKTKPHLYSSVLPIIESVDKMRSAEETRQFDMVDKTIERAGKIADVEGKNEDWAQKQLTRRKSELEYGLKQNELIGQYLSDVQDAPSYNAALLHLKRVGINTALPQSYDEFSAEPKKYMDWIAADKSRREKEISDLDLRGKKATTKISETNANYLPREKDASLDRQAAGAARDRADAERAGRDAPTVSPQMFTEENQLRSQYRAASKDFETVRDSYSKINTIVDSEPSAAGDISLVYSYMKILDPGSVVRETEYATAENARGVPETVRNLYNKTLKGQRLSPLQRADFRNRAGQIFGSAKNIQMQQRKQVEDAARSYGLDPARVSGAVVTDGPEGLYRSGVPASVTDDDIIARYRRGGGQTQGR